ncbi:MAG: LysR family substrate-binding domain-containing protein [Nocardioidaceae bacterium]
MTGPSSGSAVAFRVGFVTGATPDKWAAVWRRRRPDRPIELVPITEDEQDLRLRDDSLDVAIVRLPVRRDDLHLIRLYEEQPVVVAARDHVLAAYDEVPAADLAHEQFALPPPAGLDPVAEQLPFPPMTARDAVEVAASGSAVAILPMSVARLYHRKDAIWRPVLDLDPTVVGLAWRRDRDTPDVQEFVGVVRGRTERSSRG